MNKTQKLVRFLFLTKCGLTSADLFSLGSKNPHALVYHLRNRYGVNVQSYKLDHEDLKRYYIPPTLENISAIRQNIDLSFSPIIEKPKKVRDFSRKLLEWFFICLVAVIFLIIIF